MVQVKVNDGILEGEILDGVLGSTYYSFKGVPYAKPPIGELRFKAPQSVEPWSGIRHAKKHAPPCFQYDLMMKTGLVGSEDCLYLNVYTPNLKPDKPLPVMIWVHGGGFKAGNGDSTLYSPDFLVEQGVIIVTFNYRLELLGFLCLNTKDVTGNAGMKDQSAAFRWVKHNIHSFGGDSNNITIFGESAGAASVSFHLISPLSKGLFNRAIMQSGSCNSNWAFDKIPRQRAMAVAKEHGVVTNDDDELYEFFKNLPSESLVKVNASLTMAEEMSQQYTAFVVVDEKFRNEDTFFSGNVIEELNKGIHEGVEVIVGFTADEGYLQLVLQPINNLVENFNKYLERFVPFHLTWGSSKIDQLEIGDKFKKYYCNTEVITKDNLGPIAKFAGSNFFVFDIIQWVKFCAKKGANTVYLYKFSFISERNIMFKLLGAGNINADEYPPVVCHADDILYLFEPKIVNIPIDTKSKSYETIKKFTTLWTNFAKYGNPTPDNSLGIKWTPFTLDNEVYLNIGDKLNVGPIEEKDEISFWEYIFKKYSPENLAIKEN